MVMYGQLIKEYKCMFRKVVLFKYYGICQKMKQHILSRQLVKLKISKILWENYIQLYL